MSTDLNGYWFDVDASAVDQRRKLAAKLAHVDNHLPQPIKSGRVILIVHVTTHSGSQAMHEYGTVRTLCWTAAAAAPLPP